MKKNYLVLLLTLLSALLLGACTNLDEIKSRLDDHDKRLKALETLSTDVNKEVQNLKVLMEASSIKSYSQLPNGSGYELVMGNGKTITLKNGKDATKPMMGVKKADDGKLYWTIDGEWLLDADSQKVRAEGEDGASSVSPQLRVDSKGFWEISTDGGKQWQAILGADGLPVKAIGKDGVVDLEITEEDGVVIIRYNEQIYKLPINADSEQPATPAQPMLPLDYVAEYNLNPEGTGFVTTHEYDQSGFFSFGEAIEKFKAVEIGGKSYHLPSKDEWLAVVPGEESIYFDWAKEYNDVPETVVVNGKTIESKNDYKTTELKKTYALRYKGTDMMSAWLYEYTEHDGLRVLKITACYVGDQPNIKISDIVKSAFWDGAKGKVVRVLPAAGMKDQWGTLIFSSSNGEYLSSTPNDETMCYGVEFNYSTASVHGDFYSEPSLRTVRLFESAK